MKTIVTIQHTQSVHHTNGMTGGWTDWELTDLGCKQAADIGAALKREFRETPFTMYSSDLKRAAQTASIVAEFFGVRPVLRRELREINVGAATGKSAQWLRDNQAPQEDGISPYDYRPFRDAESRRDLTCRLIPFVEEVKNSGDENIILVSHGGALSALFSIWIAGQEENISRSQFFGLPGGVSVLLCENDGSGILKKVNDLSYLFGI